MSLDQNSVVSIPSWNRAARIAKKEWQSGTRLKLGSLSLQKTISSVLNFSLFSPLSNPLVVVLFSHVPLQHFVRDRTDNDVTGHDLGRGRFHSEFIPQCHILFHSLLSLSRIQGRLKSFCVVTLLSQNSLNSFFQGFLSPPAKAWPSGEKRKS